MDWTKPLSYLGSPIHITEGARINDARAFFRVSQNLRLARKCTLQKFARYIRFGFLSYSDAEALCLQRLQGEKLVRYQLAKYWIREGFLPESWFYFNPSALWPKEKVPGNIIEFP